MGSLLPLRLRQGVSRARKREVSAEIVAINMRGGGDPSFYPAKSSPRQPVSPLRFGVISRLREVIPHFIIIAGGRISLIVCMARVDMLSYYT